MKDQKTSTVIIKNLPCSIKQTDLEETYNAYGNIRQLFVTRSKSHTTNIGFVKFTTIEEATKAISGVKVIDGEKIISTYARKKPRKSRQPLKKENDLSESDDDVAIKNTPLKPIEVVQNNILDNLPSNKCTVFIFGLPDGLNEKDIRKKFRKIGTVNSITMNDKVTAVTFDKVESSSLSVKKLNNHIFKQSVISVIPSTTPSKTIQKMLQPSRIIIRNLSFKVTEDILRHEVSHHGNPLEVTLPKSDKNLLRGFAFVSLPNKFIANKVMQKLNGHEILGRKVAVDWAVSKDQYQKSLSKSISKDNQINDGSDDDADDAESEDNMNVDDSADIGKKDGVEDEDIDESFEDEKSCDDKDAGEEEEEKPKRLYDDVKEGKTLLLGNLPFDIEKEDIEERFESYGNIRYVRMVYDQAKDRPKGTAFVQFKEKDGADACLSSSKSNPITLSNREISVRLVVDKSKLTFKEEKKSGGKDNRNLHLAMEGVVKDGTNAAEGVSKTDLLKRKLAFEAKKKKLKNVNFFVSTTRLCVRNMPTKFNETDLKKLMSKYGHVVQVKIMRDIKRADTNGVGKSKGYGFVEFSKHEAALAALRNVNNNPNTFSAIKRPIVDFSIENGNIINARQKKVNMKQENKTPRKSFNERWKDARMKKKDIGKSKASNIPITKSEAAEQPVRNDIKPSKKQKKQKKSIDVSDAVEQVLSIRKPASSPLSRAETEPKKRNRMSKSERKSKKLKRDIDNDDEKNFRKLIDSYKNKLNSSENKERLKKWYED